MIVNLSLDKNHIDQISVDMRIQLKDQQLQCHSSRITKCYNLSRCVFIRYLQLNFFYSAVFMGLSSVKVFSISFHHLHRVARSTVCKTHHVQARLSPFINYCWSSGTSTVICTNSQKN